MTFGRWVLGAVVGGLALGAVSAQAAPLPLVAVDAPASAQTVQFFYYDDPPPVVYYEPAPPPRAYYGRPRYYPVPPPPAAPGYGHRAPGYGFYDKEAAKEYMKDYRKAEKDIHKERVRAWNRANGY
ncbi:hypothetical protein [Microvirga alba]|uniref:Uncharacterized protein n=1 Tax=Microvirga alba TaxID=2791025 RepID=A0A931FNH2_9HYPH|nr:hypothetical protein [Microvirga alba]MBF9232327.1 hypothetical protein [Microvirga alba]